MILKINRMSILNDLKNHIGMSSGQERFISVNPDEINQAEAELGFQLPTSLKNFYQVIGYGWLSQDERPDIRNLFIHPLDVVDLYQGTSEFSPPDKFLAGDVPFFDCGSCKFLVFRPNSSHTEFIYRDYGETTPVANDVDDLITKLLLDPSFYEK